MAFRLIGLFACICLLAGVAVGKDQGRKEIKGIKGEKMAELVKEDLEVGTGAEAVDGKTVTVHYTGTLTDGKKFDSSLDRKTPFSFVLGAGQVIKGWDQGVKGMKVKGRRKLTIPAHLAYGDRAVGGVIPANSTLLFTVELLDVK